MLNHIVFGMLICSTCFECLSRSPVSNSYSYNNYSLLFNNLGLEWFTKIIHYHVLSNNCSCWKNMFKFIIFFEGDMFKFIFFLIQRWHVRDVRKFGLRVPHFGRVEEVDAILWLREAFTNASCLYLNVIHKCILFVSLVCLFVVHLNVFQAHLCL